MDIPPCHTIYVQNLNNKVNKEELRRTLYALFSQCGPVLDVVALKTPKMRGQAFIVYRDMPAAADALRILSGMDLYGKAMKLQYAKSKSFATMKEQGTYTKFLSKKRREERAAARAGTAAAGADAAISAKQAKRADGSDREEEEEEHEPEANGVREGDVAPSSMNEVLPPHKILYCCNMPKQTTKEMLQALFGEFEGLVEIRPVAGRPDIAFVEFGDAAQATAAMRALNGFKLDPTHAMQVNYAKQ